MTAPTLCRDCDHPHPATRQKPPWHWRCLAYPEQPLGGFVDPDWKPDPPYMLCRAVNDGACPAFTPLRTPTNRPRAA